jgi:dipeptidyl aminopeptidase/acylaminoacyl peptidase
VGPERPIGDFSTSANGLLLYRRSARPSAPLAWYGRDSTRRSAPKGLRTDRDVSLSPDGRRLSTVELGPAQPSGDLWLYDLEKETRIRLTASPDLEYTPVWSHDGQALYFTRHERGKFYLHRQLAQSANPPARLAEWPQWFAVTDTSPDGRFVVLQARTGRGDQDLLRFDMGPGGRIEPMVDTHFDEAQGRISPDGRWLAYTSDESGRHEIYLRRLTPPPVRLLVSRQGGVQPRWNRNGRELFFVSPEGDLMAASAPWEGRAPVKLFSTKIPAHNRDATEFTQYAVSQDGQQFLLPSPSEAAGGAPWILLTNWPARGK